MPFGGLTDRSGRQSYSHIVIRGLGYAAIALGMKFDRQGGGAYDHAQITVIGIVVTFKRKRSSIL